MTDSMKERIARALAIADGRDPDADFRMLDGIMLTVAVDKPEIWRTYLKKVDAVLNAMTEPTDQMLEEGAYLTPNSQGGEGPIQPEVTREIWQAMITAAKEEGK